MEAPFIIVALLHAWALRITLGLLGVRNRGYGLCLLATIAYLLVDGFVVATGGTGLLLGLLLNLFVTMAFFRAGCGGSLAILFIGFIVRQVLGLLFFVLFGITLVGLVLLVP